MHLQYLRKKYPKFIYEKYSYKISGRNLEIFFDFTILPNIRFRPKVVIENIPSNLSTNLSIYEIDKFNKFDNLIFQLGLIEMVSYWKATCSPTIEIRAGFLNSEQINWWKDLISKGMGQFFYENKINFRKTNFIKIKNSNSTNSNYDINSAIAELMRQFNPNKILVPVGGGKDSVVTLELLKKAKKNIQCFSLNPTEPALKTIKISGCKKPIIAQRIIDRKLLELNRRGFLNGHTPFSAYLAFLSVLVATISGQKYVAFSNERSSNEGNIKYLGKTINHQWSKSFEFEEKFRKYSQKYLTPGVEYFSFLRPLYEIQIAKLFSKYSKYFPVFLSCNEAYKTASGTKKPSRKWCGKCPKCLFIFAILYPFLEEKQLLKIFKKNLFCNKNLLPTMRQLIGERGFKPFECVGTKKESLIAFYLSWKKSKDLAFKEVPFLLNYFEKEIMPKYKNLAKESKKILNSWNKQNNIPKNLEKELIL